MRPTNAVCRCSCRSQHDPTELREPINTRSSRSMTCGRSGEGSANQPRTVGGAIEEGVEGGGRLPEGGIDSRQHPPAHGCHWGEIAHGERRRSTRRFGASPRRTIMDIDTLRIETPRLILRPTRWEDFEAWAAFLADEQATRFLGGVQSRPLAWRTMMCMAG